MHVLILKSPETFAVLQLTMGQARGNVQVVCMHAWVDWVLIWYTVYSLSTKQKSVELWRSCHFYGNGTINILCASAWCVASIQQCYTSHLSAYFDFPLHACIF